MQTIFPAALLASLLVGCATGHAPSRDDPPFGLAPGSPPVNPGTPAPGVQLEPGTPVALTPSASAQADQTQIAAALAGVAGLDAATFADRYRVPFASMLDYDPSTAVGLDRIQASSVKINPEELAVLASRGFVISGSQYYPTFFHGYQTIYAADLPVYVSADSILEAVHRSYDGALKQVEVSSLLPELRRMLDGMRGNLAAAGGDQATADADVYLAVALALLEGQAVASVHGGDAGLIGDLYQAASSHSGTRDIVLFGVSRQEDFSQFAPRGHYTDTPELTRYFQAMMWIGRVDFRIIETQSDGSQVFRRRQLEAAVRLRELLDAVVLPSWSRIDAAIHAFVGEPDFMTVTEVDALLKDLGAAGSADLASIPDQRIAQTILDGGYGTQRIASSIMINGTGGKTLPLSSSFALLGQRYVIDSHVFSNVVYDRVPTMRMMPDPLDVAFAVMKNDQAGALLADQLARYRYAPNLASMRILADAHGDAFWKSNLYNLWLVTLRSLSPGADLVDPVAAGLLSVFTTEAWGRRLLNAELASWAELRHDTILYAKQSYTVGTACEFPDAYVDPYPAFYDGLRAYADRGTELLGALNLTSSLATQLQNYWANLATVAATLKGMAESERTGTPFTAEQLAFVNQAVHVPGGCGGPNPGWYGQLYFDVTTGSEYDPTIADVHTQPTDEAGNLVGRVLHVATGMPRLMVVSVNTCQGPRAYAGLAASYFEKVTEQFQRLDDQAWSADVNAVAHEPNVRWMTDLVTP